jgi:hypothetical protein
MKINYFLGRIRAFYLKKKLNIFFIPDDSPLTDMVGVGFSTKIP